MGEPKSCNFKHLRHMYRNLQKLKIRSAADLKSLDVKIERSTKELKALNTLISNVDNKSMENEKKNSIDRATQLATDFSQIDLAIKSKKTQIAQLKLQILNVDNELAKYSTIIEQSNVEKEIKKLNDRFLINNQKKNLLESRTDQLKIVVTDMLLERRRFLLVRKNLITELMAKKREVNDVINSSPSVSSNDVIMSLNKFVQQPKSRLQEMQPSIDAAN